MKKWLWLLLLLLCAGCGSTHQRSVGIFYGAYQAEYYDTKEAR